MSELQGWPTIRSAGCGPGPAPEPQAWLATIGWSPSVAWRAYTIGVSPTNPFKPGQPARLSQLVEPVLSREQQFHPARSSCWRRQSASARSAS